MHTDIQTANSISMC